MTVIAKFVPIVYQKFQESLWVFVMKNNKVRLVKSNGNDAGLVKSRNRLIRLYNAHRQKRGWRAVQQELGVKNVATVYNFAMHGIEPRNTEERVKLGIDKVRKPRKPWFPEVMREHVELLTGNIKEAAKETRQEIRNRDVTRERPQWKGR